MTRRRHSERVDPENLNPAEIHAPYSPRAKGAQWIVDLNDAVTYHQLVLASEGRSQKTSRLYLLYQKRFLEFLQSRSIPPTLDALNALNVRQAVLWFQQRQVGTRGGVVATGMFLSVLKTWAMFLEREGIWETSPLSRVRPVKVRRFERQPYTVTEVGAMLNACTSSHMPERNRFLILLLLDTGARISEITGLRLEDVSFSTKSIRVLGKGNRERTIPIDDPQQSDGGPTWRAYRAWLKVRAAQAERLPGRAGDKVFLTAAGYPLTGPGATDIVKRLGAVAGVQGAISHRFRHTFATQYLTMHPGDESGLREIMGHLSNEVMRIYTHLSRAAVRMRMGAVSLSSKWLQAR